MAANTTARQLRILPCIARPARMHSLNGWRKIRCTETRTKAMKARRQFGHSSTHSETRNWMMVSGQFHARPTLPLGKNPRYPVNRRQAEHQRQSTCFLRKGNSSAPSGNQTPDLLSRRE